MNSDLIKIMEDRMNGFMGKLLRVDLGSRTITEEPLRMDWARQYLGGAALAARYLIEETPKGIDPLSPDNQLIFMAGPLTGTASASASRYSVVAKSPQTGLLGHANSGGTFGPALKRSGYDGIIFEGVSEEPVYLKIVDRQAELLPAGNMWGKTIPETEEFIQKGEKKKLVIAAIGPAGENLVRYAAIINNQHRAAGRCGMGAVMGSKRLKAVAVAGSQAILLAKEVDFRQAARRQIDLLNESVLKIGFDAFGTNMVSDMVNVRGGYPVLNWQEGVLELIDDVNAQALTDKVLVEGVRCFACPVICGRGTEIRDGQWQGQKGEGPEYETVNTLGPLCGVSDMNAITMANYLCNHFGLDTISAGASIAFAMECYQKGLLTKQKTGGIELTFGNAELVVDLVQKIARREGIGDLLAEGTRRMAERIGRGSDHFAVHVKGLELPAYDPRAAKICGLGYVTANRGGDHMTAYVQGPTFIDMPFLIVEDSTIKDPFVANPAEAQVLVDMENALSVLDAVGGCKFMGILLTAEDIVELIANATGWEFDTAEYRQSGERIYNLMRAYCVREGVTRELDALPGRLLEDPLPGGPAEGHVVERDSLEAMKSAYYRLRGWDLESGAPTLQKLSELGMGDLAGMLYQQPAL
jgi:aldehyde:ferredoxin oxidoreductase